MAKRAMGPMLVVVLPPVLDDLRPLHNCRVDAMIVSS